MSEYYLKTGVCYDYAEYDKLFMLYTYKCNAACSHCMTESNPRRTEKLSLDIAIDIIEAAARAGKRFLVLSGGEPMIYYDELLTLFERAKALGFFICLNTNAFWARSFEIAMARLSPLVERGLQAVFPSATAFHARFVPTDNVVYAREACVALGIVSEVNFYPSLDAAADKRIAMQLNLGENDWFTDGLIKRGNDVSGLEAVYRYLHPRDLDDCGSIHLAVNPHLDVIANCNLTYSCREFHGTPLYLGTLRKQTIDDIMKHERESSLLQFLYRTRLQEVHAMLSGHRDYGSRYAETFAERRYHSATEYFLDILRDSSVIRILENHASTVIMRHDLTS